jgi:methionyl-tRNA formyltransferase
MYNLSKPILLLTKRDQWSFHAGTLAKSIFGDDIFWEEGDAKTPLNANLSQKSYFAVISFLSPWIVPQSLLDVSTLSLNFHPGSCNYPGIGCYNFALYEEATQFGAVCHHMLAKVDTGIVIKETLFPVLSSDTVETLKLRTMVNMLAMFNEILCMIAQQQTLPVNHRQWTRKAFTRKELNALCEITPDMDKAEIGRRIRATTYPGYPGPYLLKNGQKYPYPVPDGLAIA